MNYGGETKITEDSEPSKISGENSRLIGVIGKKEMSSWSLPYAQ